MHRLVIFFRWIALTIVVLTVGGVGIYFYVSARMDDELRTRITDTIAAKYPNLLVSLRRARLIENEGIEIRGLRVGPRGVAGKLPEAWLEIDEVFVACNTAITDLVAGRVDARSVTVRRATLRADQQSDGKWNLEQLCGGETSSASMPPLTIEDSTLEIHPAAASGRPPLVLRDMRLQVSPKPLPGAAANACAPLAIEGSLASEHFRRVTIAAQVQPATRTFSVRGSVDELYVSESLWKALPVALPVQFDRATTLKGVIQAQFEVASAPGLELPLSFSVSGSVAHGEWADADSPYPLAEITGKFTVDNNRVVIDDLTARSNAGTLRVSLRREGYAASSPLTLRAEAHEFTLDGRLLKFFPAELQAQWNRFQPAGLVNADLGLVYDGKTWQPDLLVECLNTSFTYDKFPYRVTGGTGTVRLHEDLLTANLRVLAGGQPVRLEAQLSNPGPHAKGTVKINSEGTIPVDENLLSAFDENTQKVLRALSPRGNISVSGQTEFLGDPALMATKHFVMRMHDCAIKYVRFPYPLERVRGTAELINGNWELRDLEGHNHGAYLVGTGGWGPASEGGTDFRLQLVGTDIPLDDELRAALPEGSQRAWSSLRPQGTLDHLKIDVGYTSRDKNLAVDVRAQKWPPQQNVEGRTVSFEPTFFRYRFDQVTGAVRYRNGRIDLEQVNAMHGPVQWSAVGDCTPGPDGSWRLRFEKATADKLRPDRDFLSALPGSLGPAIDKLKLTGLLNAEGKLEFAGTGNPSDPVECGWDLNLDVENGSLACGVELNHIHGGVRLVGNSVGNKFQSRGELALDSLMYRDFQFTKVQGPVWLDNQRMLLGGWADSPLPGKPPRQLTAAVWSGLLAADAQILLDPDNTFMVQGVLDDASLDLITRETMPGRRTTGRAYAKIELQGTARGAYTWNGRGAVRLRDADIYELPVMISTLKLLSIRRPDRTAFTTSDIDFRIQGEHLYFDRMDFNGDAISLKGNGEMGLDRQISMNFYTVMGNDERTLPILQPVLGAASRQVLLIHVTGSLDQPRLAREAFPGINETLQQLFPELGKK